MVVVLKKIIINRMNKSLKIIFFTVLEVLSVAVLYMLFYVVNGNWILTYALSTPLILAVISRWLFRIIFKDTDKKRVNKVFLLLLIALYILCGSAYWFAYTHIQFGPSYPG
jgi:FtsH-binding integral membrane protein